MQTNSNEKKFMKKKETVTIPDCRLFQLFTYFFKEKTIDLSIVVYNELNFVYKKLFNEIYNKHNKSPNYQKNFDNINIALNLYKEKKQEFNEKLQHIREILDELIFNHIRSHSRTIRKNDPKEIEEEMELTYQKLINDLNSQAINIITQYSEFLHEIENQISCIENPNKQNEQKKQKYIIETNNTIKKINTETNDTDKINSVNMETIKSKHTKYVLDDGSNLPPLEISEKFDELNH